MQTPLLDIQNLYVEYLTDLTGIASAKAVSNVSVPDSAGAGVWAGG